MFVSWPVNEDMMNFPVFSGIFLIITIRLCVEGSSIYDVTQVGVGGCHFLTLCMKACVSHFSVKGEGSQKKPQNCVTSLMDNP